LIGKVATALHAAGLFFPLDLELDLRAESYSPWILERLEWTGGNLESFQKGSEALRKLLNLEVTAKGLEKLTEKLGRERAALRDAEVSRFEKRELTPRHPEPPVVAAVLLDGGRAQIRASNAAPGVHDPVWTETKIANLATYTNVSFRSDPQPEPPSKFLDPPKVLKIVKELKGAAAGSSTAQDARTRTKTEGTKSPRKKKRREPTRKDRTVVATVVSSERIGSMVAAEAQRRGFYHATKKGFVEILDFVHLLSHLYAAAQAAYSDPRMAWKLYEKLVTLAWAGKVAKLKKLLRKHSERIGQPPRGVRDDDPRKVLALAFDYVEKNSKRMEYARYRRAGLPISSAPVESLINEVNLRVKSSAKFWTREGLEAILQVRAANLSDDDRERSFWQERPLGRAVGCSLYRRAA
jgi:hypothetical protein